MNKWIAEFDLEDGDRMPEHMDLNYMGAKIDFHCKPLEQEPFINKPCVSSEVCEHDKNKVLDKIRAEIEEKCFEVPYKNQAFDYGLKIVKWSDVREVLDKYKADRSVDNESTN